MTVNWYRIWSDGWIEQGGRVLGLAWQRSGGERTITLMKPYKNTNYNISATMVGFTANWNSPGCLCRPISATQIRIGVASANNIDQGQANCDWYTSGY